ncbi:MAG: CPBP family intramembrane glutamic endopeptidase [Thermoplasmata archaeon]
MAGAQSGDRAGGSRGSGSLRNYLIATAVTVLAIYSQYFVPELVPAAREIYGGLLGSVAIVYLLPVVVFALLVGGAPLRHYRTDMRRAAVEGLRWYGLLSLLALFVTLLLGAIYQVVDPSALGFLHRPNPELVAAASNPWFFIGFSFVAGAFEELLFRGWIFGFWLQRSERWLLPAIASSALFALVHLYYASTYTLAAPLIFPTLFFLGFAFAGAVRASGGNLVVVALLHGATDAIAFYSLLNEPAALGLHYGLILVGALIGLLLYLKRPRPGPPPAGIAGSARTVGPPDPTTRRPV